MSPGAEGAPSQGAPESHDMLDKIRIRPGKTNEGKPFDWKEQELVEKGVLRLELIPADVLGLTRPLEVYRKTGRGPFVKIWKNKDTYTACPEHLADIMIGEGSCGLRCRTCFLVGTHRIRANPSRHILYENTDDIIKSVGRWLKKPKRRSLGIGIDHSDSLLYEGVTGHARQIIPLIASPDTNPEGVRLVLLTKSTNIHYLEGLPTDKVVVSFSINPEPIADLWEGKYNDGVRVSPSIADRVAASLQAQDMGFEVRWRVDPILHPDGWEAMYEEFFADAARRGFRPARITLGMYRQNSANLLTLARKWGLPPPEWTPALDSIKKLGGHYREPEEIKIPVYRRAIELIRQAWRGTGHEPTIGTCKECPNVRRAIGITHPHCNCE